MIEEPVFSEFSKEFIQPFIGFFESPAPEAGFVSRLERQLLQRQTGLLHGFPTGRLWFERCLKQFSFSVRQRNWQYIMVIALLTLALLSIFIFARIQVVDAQSILTRARSVASDLQASGISSFEMVSETTSYLNESDGSMSQTPVSQSQLHTWYQETNQWRYEMRFLDNQNQKFDLNPQVTVADGKTIWSYDPKQNFLQINEGVFGVGGKGGGVGLYGTSGGIETILTSLSQCYDPSPQVGRGEIIAGRKTYKISLGVSKCPSNAAAAFNGSQTLWIDQKTFFVLKWETRDLSSQKVIRVMNVTEIQYNPQLPASLFTFTPPQGARVLDNRSSSPQNGSTATQTQTSVVTPTPDTSIQATVTPTPQPPFPLLEPSWLPEEMRESVQIDGEIVTLLFDPRPDDSFHPVLTLSEIPVYLIDAGGEQDPQASQEQIGTHDVTIIRRGQGCTNFTWYEDDLQLSLNNVYDPPGQLRYSCDQLRKVIESIH